LLFPQALMAETATDRTSRFVIGPSQRRLSKEKRRLDETKFTPFFAFGYPRRGRTSLVSPCCLRMSARPASNAGNALMKHDGGR